MRPRYQHDCNACIFLGQYKEFDLYFCYHPESDIDTTLICRYSSEGSEYCSGLTFALNKPEARNRHYQEALWIALKIPAFKEKIVQYFSKYEKERVEKQERLKEMILISETPPENLPLIINGIKHYTELVRDHS